MSNQKVTAIIQARMSSSRLPGKVLLDIAGRPMLQWVVERARGARSVDVVVVATTNDPSDDPVAAFCQDQDIPYTRGSLHDVLDRYVQTARKVEADIIVRLTADCPLLDPALLDETVQALLDADLDFAANRLPPPWGRSFPIGLDVEVATRAALERAWAEATETHHREHVMPYFYDDMPEEAFTGRPPLEIAATPRGFCIGLLQHAPDHGALRWTVDTPEDLAAVRAFAEILPGDFGWREAVDLWLARPDISAINASVAHKSSRDVDSRAV